MVKAVIFFLVVGYLIGCIHGSKVAQFLSGVDLKKAGHGNAGASNATLSLGWKYGVLVALIDIGKGVVAIVGAHFYLADATHLKAEQIWLRTYLISAGVVLGHHFLFWFICTYSICYFIFRNELFNCWCIRVLPRFLYRYLFMDSWIRPNHYCHSTFWYCYYFAL